MLGDSESRSRYLTLALLARRAINSLRAVAAGDPIDQALGDSLHKLLAGTERGGEAAQFVTHLQTSGAWTYFEELSTVDELKNETGTVDLGAVVTSVLGDANEESRRRNAKRLIGFLTAVESRALQHYTDSMEPQLA